jgi:hypothetical protein
MRNARAACNRCGWKAISATEVGVVDMAREHQAAVQGHSVRIAVPEGWFGWKSYDIYPLPELTERQKLARERMAREWNPPYRFNGD